MLSVILIKLEGGGDGREVLDSDHLLLRHGLELPDGIVHDGGELRSKRSQNFSNQSLLEINIVNQFLSFVSFSNLVNSFLLLECCCELLLSAGSAGGKSVVV